MALVEAVLLTLLEQELGVLELLGKGMLGEALLETVVLVVLVVAVALARLVALD